jgi:hypothetical protein
MRKTALVLALIPFAAACARGAFDDVGITAVELRSAPRLEFLRARVGMKFLEVRFEFENKGGEPLPLQALDFSLRDAAGQLYPFSAQVLNMGQPRGVAEARIEAGQRVPGSVVFQVPERAVPGELIYRQDAGGGLAISLKPSG